MKDKTFIGGSMVAAVVASFCCILPIVFALTGITVLGAAGIFAEWRRYLLAVTFALLGLGFYFAYRSAPRQCEPGGACPRPATGRSGRLVLWIATPIVVALAAFPYYSALVAEIVMPPGTQAIAALQPAPRLERLNLAIEGMDCPSCAVAIEKKLKAVPGVREAKVLYAQGRAEIDYDPSSASVDRLQGVIQEAGYRSRKIGI